MKVEKTNHPLDGVKCVVNTCDYNHNDHCHASSIEVQSPEAETTEMTDCATFIPKDMV